MSVDWSQLASRYAPLAVLLAWGAALIGFGLVRFEPYGIDEGAAMALLLNWSVSDQIVNPVSILGGPDFRALLFIPLGLYWSGSMIAAKVFTLGLTFAAILFLYRWSQRQHGDEAALIASGLMLIAPATIMQVDRIGLGPFLILMFAIGAWLDTKYRASGRSINSWYFVQIITVVITVTLHPAGLAYPLALAWHWKRNPVSTRQQRQVWIGIGSAVMVVFAMQTGWIALDWFANPLDALSMLLLGNADADPQSIEPLWGLIPATLLLLALKGEIRALTADPLGLTLLLGLILGLLVADGAWGLLALTLILYRGIPKLIALNQRVSGQNFAGQRGLTLAVVFVTATLFMHVDKVYALALYNGLKSPEDQLIQALAIEAEDADQRFLAASQWPARSMLACRRDVLPLPPPREDGQALLHSIKGVTHVMFDHQDPRHSQLARNFAELAGVTETLVLQPSGVIIRITGENPDAAEPGSTDPGH